MATVSNYNIAEAIYAETNGKTGAELKNSLDKVVKFLARRRLISKSSEILSSLSKIIDKSEERMVVQLKSHSKLKEETKKEITHLLKKHYIAKHFVFIESIDEKLLGGVRIEIENEVIDLSIKNKIGQLQEYLNRV